VTFSVVPPTSSPTDPVLLAAGDIADCNSTGDEATASLLDGQVGSIITTGDNVYESGTDTEFANCYNPTWGRHKARTSPAVGDHEYVTPGAAGYFRYFGAAAGNAQADTAWNAGAWHMIGLNGECGDVGGCGATSPQGQFLRSHLGSKQCTLAYWHEPYDNGNNLIADYRSFWQTLSAAGADVVLNGHIHTYARFAPQDPDGQVDAAHGIRQFIVGTGGKSQGSIPGTHNVEFTQSGFGILELRLHDASYDWKYVAVDGSVIDSGSAACH